MTTLQALAVNYFGCDSVRRLVQSFLTQDSPDWRLVVVDNSASPDELDRLRKVAEVDERVTVEAAPSNLGYFGGAHWWVSRNAPSADWLAVCNTDLWLADVSFVSTLSRMPADASILAPDITVASTGRAQNPFLTTRPSRRRTLLRTIVLSHRVSSRAAWRMTGRKPAASAREEDLVAADIYAPHGACVLFHRTYFEAGGTLAHEPFLYFEEITVAERARQLGQRVRFEPSLKIIHSDHQATGRGWEAPLFRAQREGARYAHRVMTRARRSERWEA